MDRPVLDSVAWRILWDEQVPVETRKQIARTVRRGGILASRDDAAVAAEFTIRRARSFRIQIALSTALGVALVATLAAMKPEHPSGLYWFQFGMWGLYTPTIAILGAWQLRRLCVAYHANRALSSEPGDGTD